MKKLTLVLFCLLLGIGWASAQEREVRGVVISAEDNQPIIQASIVVKGQRTIGTSSDFDGNFVLKVPADAKYLEVSYVGMLTQEVKIKPNLRIVLESDSKALDEVIVVAFGKAKKSAFTGSAVQVDSKELEKRQVSNVTQALAGKAPGVTVSSGNNQPGFGAAVRIRGIGSFSAGTGPLYVVDGVPFSGDIASINPQDIESTSILKDAASAALYGARGANGVIMITTKSGSASKAKMSITFEARYGFNTLGVSDYDKLSDPKMYAAKYFEGIYNSQVIRKGATPESAFDAAKSIYFSKDEKVANLVYHPFTVPEGQEWFIRQANGSFAMNPATTVGTMYTGSDGKEYWLRPDNWRDEAFTTNPRQEYNLSVSGADDKANYYFSTGYLSDNGYIVKSSFDRVTARLRGDYRPVEWLKLGGNIGFTHYKSNTLNNTGEGGNSGNIFAMTNFIGPIYPLYVYGQDKNILIDKWGHKVPDFGTGEYPGLTRPFLSIANPLALLNLDTNESKADIIASRAYVDFNILKGLKATVNIGYDSDNTYFLEKKNVYYGQFAGYGGIVSREYSRNASINAQQLLTYITRFGKHNLDFLLGHEFYKNRSNGLWGSKENMYNPDNTEVSGAILKPSTGSSESIYATEGYLGRVQYDYASKYFAQFSYRRDASSRFHKDHRWGNFWSLGSSWLISNEDFMANLDMINLLKLKVSYGMQGNDAIGSYRYLDLYSMKNANDKLAVAFSSKGNENLTWETSSNLNVGLEFGLYKNRISGSLDVYSREVSDMLFWRPVPRSSGYGGYYDNIGKMRNTGFDFQLQGEIINTKDVVWSLSVNGGYFKNKLKKLPEEWEAVEDGYRDGNAVYRVGGSIYDRAYAHYLGVNDEGKPTWQTYDKETGEYGVTDDANIATRKENRKVFTNMAPKLNGGISTNVDFFGFDFSATFSYALGGKTMDGTYQSLMHGGTGRDSGHAWHKDILKSWTPENTDTDIPMVNYSGKFANTTSDRFMISRDYLALNNLTLGYTLPSNLLSNLKVKAIRLYIVGDNVALLSARKGFDPRFGGGVGYKTIRSFSGGIRVTL